MKVCGGRMCDIDGCSSLGNLTHYRNDADLCEYHTYLADSEPVEQSTVFRCPQGQALNKEWLLMYNDALKVTGNLWSDVLWMKRPYDIHVESCEQCRAYQLEQQEKYHEVRRDVQNLQPTNGQSASVRSGGDVEQPHKGTAPKRVRKAKRDVSHSRPDGERVGRAVRSGV